HFLARYESVEAPLYIDGFSQGRILTQTQTVRWLSDAAKLPPARLRRSLGGASPRAIVIRLHNNLNALPMQQQNWGAAWIVQHRLAALQPAAWQEQVDLAVISLRADRPGHAIDLLQSCIGACPQTEKAGLERHLAEAYVQQSLLN